MGSDTAEDFARVMTQSKRPDLVAQRLITSYETPSVFTFAFPKLERIDGALKDVDEETLTAMCFGPGQDILTSLVASRVRKVLYFCKNLAMKPGQTPYMNRLENLHHASEWAENIRPKLTTDRTA